METDLSIITVIDSSNQVYLEQFLGCLNSYYEAEFIFVINIHSLRVNSLLSKFEKNRNTKFLNVDIPNNRMDYMYKMASELATRQYLLFFPHCFFNFPNIPIEIEKFIVGNKQGIIFFSGENFKQNGILLLNKDLFAFSSFPFLADDKDFLTRFVEMIPMEQVYLCNSQIHDFKLSDSNIYSDRHTTYYNGVHGIDINDVVSDIVLKPSCQYRLPVTTQNHLNQQKSEEQITKFKNDKFGENSYIYDDSQTAIYDNSNPPHLYTAVDRNLEKHVKHVYASAYDNTGDVVFHVLCSPDVSDNAISDYESRGWIVHKNLDIPINFQFGRITRAMYYRWLIPEISSTDKAIYVDNDVLILGNLNELWNLDIADSYCAAVPDMFYHNIYDGWFIHSRDRRPVDLPEEYKKIKSYSSGQLLINCIQWRKHNLKDKMIKIANKYQCYDMMAMNVVLENRVYELPKEWCVPGFSSYIRGKATSEIVKQKHLLYIQDQEFKYPKLLHFNGPAKPWTSLRQHKKLYNFYNQTNPATFRPTIESKFIVIGSAPYVKDYWNENKNYYIENDYTVCAFNNAWAVDPDNVDIWFHPDDFWIYSQCIPERQDLEKFKEYPMPRSRVNGYLDKDASKSTMLLNVLHILFNENRGKKIEVVVMGSDLVYPKNTDENSHFYGKSSTLNPQVQKLLLNTNKQYTGINADPLRFGDSWLDKELENIKRRYLSAGHFIYVDTPNKETRLPFERKVK